MPSRLSLYVFLALLAACVLSVSTGTSDLPEKIAIHFNARNEADVWIVRDQYRFLILLCLIGLPLILVWIMAWLPRLTGGKGKSPIISIGLHLRDVTERFLLAHACWLGCFTVAIVYGIHISIQGANAQSPAAMDLGE